MSRPAGQALLVFAVDPATEAVLGINSRVLEISGFALTDLTGKTIQDLLGSPLRTCRPGFRRSAR